MKDKTSAVSDFWGNVLIGKVVTPIGMLFFLAGTTLAMVEVFRRYIMGSSFIWQQDLVCLLVLMGATMFFTVAQWEHTHIAVTALAENLLRVRTPAREKAVRILRAVANAWTAVFFALLLWWGLPLITEYRVGNIRTQSLTFAYWPFFAFFLLSFAPLIFTFALHAYQGFAKKKVGGKGLDEVEEALAELEALEKSGEGK